MSLSDIFGGYETLHKQFFEIFETKGKNSEKLKKSEKIEKTKFRWRYFIDLRQYFDRNIENFVPWFGHMMCDIR